MGRPKKINPITQPVISSTVQDDFIPPPKFELDDTEEESDIELLKILKKVANKHQVAMLAMMAPIYGKKTNPVDLETASIGQNDELNIEASVKAIKEKSDTKKLFLLIESPGGLVSSSYKIASYLRDNFTEITVFIIHQAMSGGALISMTGNKVVMEEMACLSPIDIQIPYKGNWVSVNRMSSALTRLREFFTTKTPDQVPYPYVSLVDKLDPILFDDWASKTAQMSTYAAEILSKSGYEQNKIVDVVINFVYTTYPHSFIINKSKAAEYGLCIQDSKEWTNEVNAMRWWLNKYLKLANTNHYIRYITPDIQNEQQ